MEFFDPYWVDCLLIYNKNINSLQMMDLSRKHDSPLNTSSSKQLFTFKKSPRFTKITTEGPDATYELYSKRKEKSFSFGKQKRMHTDPNSNQSPQIGIYKIDSSVEKLLKKKQGVKILYGRNQCKANSIFKQSDTPGPGAYNPNPQLTESRIAIELSIAKALKRKDHLNDSPGPGTYQMQSSLMNQDRILSTDMKRAVGKILFEQCKPIHEKSQSFPQVRKRLHYQGFPMINSKGEKTFQGKGFSLGKTQRFFKKQQSINIPGPGSYEKFSQFIESKK